MEENTGKLASDKSLYIYVQHINPEHMRKFNSSRMKRHLKTWEVDSVMGNFLCWVICVVGCSVLQHLLRVFLEMTSICISKLKLLIQVGIIQSVEDPGITKWRRGCMYSLPHLDINVLSFLDLDLV